MSEMEVPAPPAPDPPPDETPAWSGPSQDEWEQTQQQLSQYQELIQQLQPPQPQYQEQQGPTPPDPWSETYQQDMEAYVDSKLAFVQQLQNEMVQHEGHEAAMASFDRLSSSIGDFDKEMAWTLARELVAQSGRVPTSERESEQILAQAAQQVREYEKRVGEAYHQAQLEQMQTVAGGQRRLPPGPQGAQTVSAGGYGNVPYAVANRFFGSDKS